MVVGMMCSADRMAVVGMGVPVETPTPGDVAVVRSPVDPDAGEDPEDDPCIEDARIEPVPRPAGVQPFKREEASRYEHSVTSEIVTTSASGPAESS
jgi:hypothetical protein